MKRLFWDKVNDSFLLRNKPEWCNFVIDKDNKMTINYNDQHKEKIITKTFSRTTVAMNVANTVYERLYCHFMGRKKDFDVKLPGQDWDIK